MQLHLSFDASLYDGPTVLSPLLALDGVSSLFASCASPTGSPNRDPSPTSDSPDRAPLSSLPLTARCSVAVSKIKPKGVAPYCNSTAYAAESGNAAESCTVRFFCEVES